MGKGNWCCWCGEEHEKEEDCWLNSEDAKEKLWNPIIKELNLKKYEM